MKYRIKNNALIAQDMEGVERVLINIASDSPDCVSPIINELILAGGKRLRPALLLISGHLGRYDPERMIMAAAALELIHLAALIHDDIIDEAQLRRGVPTINVRLGREVAVFAGDYLFTEAFSLVADRLPTELLPEFSRAVNTLCRGEMLQFASRYDLNISSERYLGIVRGKTASLFELAASLGGKLGGLPEHMVFILDEYGLALGLAFQITDDVLDLSGDVSRTGKDVMKDIAQGIYTLPIIYALEHPTAGPELRRLLTPVAAAAPCVMEHAMGQGEGTRDASCEGIFPTILRIVMEAHSIQRAIQTAHDAAARASSLLDELPESPYRELLHELACYVIERDN